MKEITKSHQTTIRCLSSRLSRRYPRKWPWLSLRLTSTNKHKLLSNLQSENRNFTPQKQSKLLLPTTSLKQWMLKRFLSLSYLTFQKILITCTTISSCARSHTWVLLHWYIAGAQVTYLTDHNRAIYTRKNKTRLT